MIHFDCPNCGRRLDIDSGFRGAVARCSHCDALIHVPVKPGAPGLGSLRRSRPGRPPDLAHGPQRRPGATTGGRSAFVWALGVVVLLALGAFFTAWLLSR